MKIICKKIKVSELPGLDITMPQIVIGQGNPKITIMTGVHGNEETGLVIIKKLLETLPNKNLRGTLQILPSCNPLAQGFKSRVTPSFDFYDLNRQFPGDDNGQFTKQLAKVIFQLVQGSNCVLDLHTFTMLCPLIGIFFNVSNQKKTRRVLAAFEKMQPDLIWRLDVKEGFGLSFTGALGNSLNNSKVDFISLETPKIYRITDEQLNRSIKAIINLLIFYGLLRETPQVVKRKIPIYERSDLRSKGGGLFIPLKFPLESVREKEVIGELYSLQNFQCKKIKSPNNGLVMMIRDKSLISTGDKLISIGQEVIM
jgi:predicted deacylase